MRVNTKQAVRLFFQNPSLIQVFKEAVANSLDANANRIDINIFIDSFDKQETLSIEIIDNGEGFTDDRYNKFCELLKVEEETHQGVGRLVYLSYFNKIEVCSLFDGKLRTFTFNDSFDENNTDMSLSQASDARQETKLIFTECSMKRLSSYSDIMPERLKQELLKEFYPRLYLLIGEGKEFQIKIKIDVAHRKNITIGAFETTITSNDIPEMNTLKIDSNTIELFADTYLDYAIQKTNSPSATFLMTAFCVDNRTKVVDDIISLENLPSFGYNFIFLLRSTILKGKIDPSRQNLTLNESVLKPLKTLFRKKIAEVIETQLPSVKERNDKTKESLDKTYPHLLGYFNKDEVGIISRSKSVEEAQKLFLRDQKTILEAQSLDEEKYDKALDVSSRTLAEYILYREKIISKVEQYTAANSEADLHNLILPKRSILKDGNMESIYTHNLWLLDNKYMTYTTAMSERTMTEVLDEITKKANSIEDDGRPDIAIIFSDNPEKAEDGSVDVVIIELKKRGITLAKTEEVESQLQQRAIKLLNYYPNKIQRMWFYGIVEFNDDFRLSLENREYTPLFSKDYLYYRENSWKKSLDDDTKYTVGTYILSIDAFIKDAKAHNEIFLNILKEGFKQKKN